MSFYYTLKIQFLDLYNSVKRLPKLQTQEITFRLAAAENKLDDGGEH